MAVLLETSQGDIVIDLYTEQRPKCSLNFLKLCKMKYYNFCLFHTVQRNFLAQTGDPTGMTEGGSSIWGVTKGDEYRFFEGESAPRLKHEKMGTVSMVNNGNGCHGSQFFITTGENLGYLDGKHTVFGEVAEGVDVLMKINEAYCDKQGRPYQDIRIYHTVVLEDPFDDPEGLVAPSRSPSPPQVITDSNRIGAEEDVDDFKGLSEEQIQKVISSREAKANAQILEMVGDIPDADGRPPENVLFVCKLNPATTAEDLEIIFSRFGAILTCEVIKDHKTGDSLQYAFIEFEKEDDCISAYFKMDNVLIDDRRIHVDFCQSLAKVKGARRRTFSEEDPMDMKKARSDGLVSKEKTRAGDYEMVFDEAEMGRPLEKKKEKRKRHDSDNGSDRKHSRAQERERRDDRRERLEKDGRDEERRGGHGDSGQYHQERERERRRDDRGGRESYKRPRQRDRSRSRSRERHYRHHKERKRSRSRSRERHRRH